MTPELQQIKDEFTELYGIVDEKHSTIELILSKIDSYDLDQEFDKLITRMGELQRDEMEFYKKNTGR